MTGIPTTDVLVIGGGCIGLASAIALAGRGTKVTLVERGLPGAANGMRRVEVGQHKDPDGHKEELARPSTARRRRRAGPSPFCTPGGVNGDLTSV